MSQELRRFKAEIFQALAHPTRIAIVEALRHGETSAGQLIERLGLEQANASQHLTVLRSKQIVISRKEGNQVFYSLRDPVLIEVLDILKRVFLFAAFADHVYAERDSEREGDHQEVIFAAGAPRTVICARAGFVRECRNASNPAPFSVNDDRFGGHPSQPAGQGDDPGPADEMVPRGEVRPVHSLGALLPFRRASGRARPFPGSASGS